MKVQSSLVSATTVDHTPIFLSPHYAHKFLRQPGQRETIKVIETVDVFGQDVPPVIIMKGEKHLYGWYYGKMPDHWTTAVSPNGWADG